MPADGAFRDGAAAVKGELFDEDVGLYQRVIEPLRERPHEVRAVDGRQCGDAQHLPHAEPITGRCLGHRLEQWRQGLAGLAGPREQCPRGVALLAVVLQHGGNDAARNGTKQHGDDFGNHGCRSALRARRSISSAKVRKSAANTANSVADTSRPLSTASR